MTERQPPRRDIELTGRDVVDLKEHLEKVFGNRLQEMEKHYDWRLDQLDRSRQDQAGQFDRRLQNMDEIQRTKFPTREDMAAITERFLSETEQLRTKYGTDIAELKESRAEMRGKASQNSVVFAILMASVALLIEIATLFVRMS